MHKDDKRHKKTVKHATLATNVGYKRWTRESKKLVTHWEKAIYRRRPGGNFWCRIQHAGRREQFTLRTPIKHVAAQRARDLYLAVITEGWDAALAKLKPELAPVARDRSTIGEFLDELKATADIRPKTLEGYAVALRKIVSDAFKIDGGREKFDYRKGGRQRWIERIHAIRLSELTPKRMQQWKRDFLDRAGDDPIRGRAARISVNSFLRRAKSLFAPDAVKHLTIQLPSPLPFEGVRFEPRQSQRYFSTIDRREARACGAGRTRTKRRTGFSRVRARARRGLAPDRD